MQHFDAYMNPATHQMQQTIYMASYNDAPVEKDDIFKIMSWVPPAEIEDKAAAVHASSSRTKPHRRTSNSRHVTARIARRHLPPYRRLLVADARHARSASR